MAIIYKQLQKKINIIFIYALSSDKLFYLFTYQVTTVGRNTLY